MYINLYVFTYIDIWHMWYISIHISIHICIYIHVYVWLCMIIYIYIHCVWSLQDREAVKPLVPACPIISRFGSLRPVRGPLPQFLRRMCLREYGVDFRWIPDKGASFRVWIYVDCWCFKKSTTSQLIIIRGCSENICLVPRSSPLSQLQHIIR